MLRNAHSQRAKWPSKSAEEEIAMGEKKRRAFRVEFDRELKLEFRGARVVRPDLGQDRSTEARARHVVAMVGRWKLDKNYGSAEAPKPTKRGAPSK